MTQWTDEQRRAIEARGSHILLSAAAGSGKTTVLVERVLRLITEDGADVDRMLVVTFTRAAASDMRAKLSRQLSERAAADERCREQLLRLDRACISTLHSFCADFLRANFETAGVDPAFRVLDDAVADRLRDEALDEALEEAYAAGGEALMALDYGRGAKGVREAAALMLKQMQERPDPQAWLDEAARCDDERLAAWQDELKDAARRSLNLALVHERQALELPDCPDNFRAAIEQDVPVIEQMAALEEYDALYRAMTGFKAARAGNKGAGGDEAAKKAVSDLRDKAKEAITKARLCKLPPLVTLREDARRLSGQIATLCAIVRSAYDKFEAAKEEQSGLTYSDLEHRTLRALSDPNTARAQRERFDYVFVDEYQDTSDIQEAIIRAIRREDNVFMVGDVKQSIYRFRLAEPRLFLEKYAAYARGEGGQLLSLTRNFRSRRGILDFVNLVFERAMTGGDAEIEYDEQARLNPGLPDAAAGEGPDVAIHLIDTEAVEAEAPEEGEDDLSEAPEVELKGIERQGVLIASEIRRMMAEDASLRFRDFAILTRSKVSAFSALMPMMLAQGIPAYADGQAGYFDAMEVSWLLSMLRLLANRRSDVEMIAMLYSPAVGLSADDLARIRVAAPKGAEAVPYVDAVASYAAEHDDAIAQRLRDFLAQLDGWKLQLGGMGLGEFVRLVLDESGFYTYAGALPGGAQRQANLDQFVAIAANFDREISGSLTRFLSYTEHMRQKGDGDAAHLLGENDDVVRMMSVHKSKGLEFKVVFGAQLEKKYRTERIDTPVVTHRSLGVGMRYVDEALRTRRQTLPQAAIIERASRENTAEEMRILYVMLTRAQEKLVLLGSAKGVAKQMSKWQALSAAPFAAQNHLELIMAAWCAAEAEGKPTHSTLQVHPADELRLMAPAEGDTGAAELFEAIMAAPQDYADEALMRGMAWEYPDPLSARKPLKLTASGLLREIEGPETTVSLLERPQFMMDSASRMTGAERGTAYHRAMQTLDLDALQGLAGRALLQAVTRQLDDLANRRMLSDAQREAIRPAKICAFLENEVGLRLRAAREIRREWAFNVMLRASEALTPEEAGRFTSEEILVQGTIDCCFIEDGAWILLDYKTDRTEDMDALRAHYEKQLHVYALALERITGMPVKEQLLCLISSGGVLAVNEG